MGKLKLCLAGLCGALAGVSGDSYCPQAPATPQDRRESVSRFRMVHFNAEWLFIDGYDDCPGSGCPWEDDEAAQHHLHSIAEVVRELDADLVNLAEVESCDELHDLMNTEQLQNMGYEPYMVQGKDTSTGQDVGMLTRVDPSESLFRTENRVDYPIPSSTCSSQYSGSYGVSKHYLTTMNVSGIPIAIVSCHLLAYPDNEDRCVQREAQVSVMAEAIGEFISRGYEVIFTGDFNDFDAEVVDANNNLPISQVMDIAKGNTNPSPGWTLHNVASLMPEEDRYTIWWDSNYDCVYGKNETSMIDHILVTPALKDKISHVFFDHTAFTPACGSFYSDHWPLVVDFDF